MMAPINPVAPSAYQGQEQDWVRPAQPSRATGRWRILAPAFSGLAVIAVVAGLTLASGGAGRPRAAGSSGAGAPPRFYVTLNHQDPHETAIVRSTATGQVLSTVHVPEADQASSASIAATSSGRVFYLTASGRLPKSGRLATVILRLSLSADGRSAKLTRLPGYLHDPARPVVQPPFVSGMAVSPDGRQLAAMIEVKGTSPNGPMTPITELVVVPLNSLGHPAIWRAKGHFALGSDVTWVGGDSVAFLWDDRFKGDLYDFTARTAVRLLNLRTSDRNLLRSSVLMTGGGGLGVIEEAYVPPGGGPIIAALARDLPATGPKGTALVRLVAASPVTGKITATFARGVLHYRTDLARGHDDFLLQVLGLDASGRNALVERPQFGMIRQGKFTVLPSGPREIHGAAW